jgi:hypothetical protein
MALFPILLNSLVLRKNYVMLVVLQVQEDFCHAIITASVKGKSPLKYYGLISYLVLNKILRNNI